MSKRTLRVGDKTVLAEAAEVTMATTATATMITTIASFWTMITTTTARK
jgi:hypothetical protein